MKTFNNNILSTSVVSVAATLTHTTKARDICDKFTDAFTLFGDCHKMYDSSTQLTDTDIDKLGIVLINVGTS